MELLGRAGQLPSLRLKLSNKRTRLTLVGAGCSTCLTVTGLFNTPPVSAFFCGYLDAQCALRLTRGSVYSILFEQSVHNTDRVKG
jgi:hypothetical protein